MRPQARTDRRSSKRPELLERPPAGASQRPAELLRSRKREKFPARPAGPLRRGGAPLQATADRATAGTSSSRTCPRPRAPAARRGLGLADSRAEPARRRASSRARTTRPDPIRPRPAARMPTRRAMACDARRPCASRARCCSSPLAAPRRWMRSGRRWRSSRGAVQAEASQRTPPERSAWPARVRIDHAAVAIRRKALLLGVVAGDAGTAAGPR